MHEGLSEVGDLGGEYDRSIAWPIQAIDCSAIAGARFPLTRRRKHKKCAISPLHRPQTHVHHSLPAFSLPKFPGLTTPLLRVLLIGDLGLPAYAIRVVWTVFFPLFPVRRGMICSVGNRS